jgi:hypothetical protein
MFLIRKNVARWHHEAHKEHEGRKHFFEDSMPSPLSDLRVLRDLRGEDIFPQVVRPDENSQKVCASETFKHSNEKVMSKNFAYFEFYAVKFLLS